jgi:hypothetical protein
MLSSSCPAGDRRSSAHLVQVDANAALGKEDVPVGSCIIRPNVRGNAHVIDVSIKTAHGRDSSTPVIMVVQLQESEKPQGRGTRGSPLGSRSGTDRG